MPRVQVLLPLPSSREPANAYDSAFAGFFHAKIVRLDTLYRYRISVAKPSKRPNIREYSNCCRLVHHQKSISQFREKGRSCTVCRGWGLAGRDISEVITENRLFKCQLHIDNTIKMLYDRTKEELSNLCFGG